ncbi:hypothetical protein PO909_007992 [Leuciscus waleckii]
MALLTPLNVNCHASDGRKVGPLPASLLPACEKPARGWHSYIAIYHNLRGFNALQSHDDLRKEKWLSCDLKT